MHNVVATGAAHVPRSVYARDSVCARVRTPTRTRVYAHRARSRWRLREDASGYQDDGTLVEGVQREKARLPRRGIGSCGMTCNQGQGRTQVVT